MAIVEATGPCEHGVVDDVCWRCTPHEECAVQIEEMYELQDALDSARLLLCTERDALGSQLLDVQQDCATQRKRADNKEADYLAGVDALDVERKAHSEAKSAGERMAALLMTDPEDRKNFADAEAIIANIEARGRECLERALGVARKQLVDGYVGSDSDGGRAIMQCRLCYADAAHVDEIQHRRVRFYPGGSPSKDRCPIGEIDDALCKEDDDV